MPAEIVTVEFCPQYYSCWEVEGSKGAKYETTLNGAEQAPYCTCPAFKYSTDQNCKHIVLLWTHCCLFNPQWKDPGPNDYAEHGIKLLFTDEMHTLTERCPGCDQPMIPVRIAV